MKHKEKAKNQGGEIEYWKSSSDLMTALILILLLIIMFLILYILETPDKEYEKELKYDEVTEEYDANGKSLKTSDKTSYKETDNKGGEKEDDYEEHHDNGGGGGGNGNDDGTGEDDPGEGDGSKSAVLASLVDGETGKAIPAKGVTFELYSDSKALTVLNTYYPKKKSYRTYKTDEEGQFYLPEKVLATSYYFHQLSDFNGYDIADKVEFTIDGAYDWPDPFLVKIPMYPLRDVIRIQMIDQDNGQAVSGGTFEIIAKEDITTLDDTVRVKKGESAGTITCDEKGYGESGRLYLGKYKVVQKDIPQYYSSIDQEIDVTLKDLTSAGEDTDGDEKTGSKSGSDEDDTNQRSASDDEEVIDYNNLNTVKTEKTRITFILTDELTGEAVSGAVFDVTGPNINEQRTTDEGGQIVLDEVEKDGTYEFSEVSAPGDYIASVDPVKVKVSNKGRIGKEAKADVEATNRLLRLDVGVRDAILRTHILGMKVELFTSSGKAVDAWTTNGSFHEVTGLELGDYYVNLNGDSSKKYKVTVTDTANIQTLNVNLFTTQSYAAIGGAAAVAAILLLVLGIFIGRARNRRRKEAVIKSAEEQNEGSDSVKAEVQTEEKTEKGE